MTREETIETLKTLKEQAHNSGANTFVWDISIDSFNFDMAIKAIKEPSVNETLEKIRAEIKQKDFDFGDFYDHTETIREMVVEIIDKYKAESEE